MKGRRLVAYGLGYLPACVDGALIHDYDFFLLMDTLDGHGILVFSERKWHRFTNSRILDFENNILSPSVPASQ